MAHQGTKARVFHPVFLTLIPVGQISECGKLDSNLDFMTEDQLAKIIVAIAYDIHKRLGPGLFESVYETIMLHELTNKYQLHVVRQFPIPVVWDNTKMELGFRADLLVENKVIIELKSIEMLAPVHYKQVLIYLRLSGVKLGFVINFNEELIKNGIKRIINGSLN
jgi:GxxExxY protein